MKYHVLQILYPLLFVVSLVIAVRLFELLVCFVFSTAASDSTRAVAVILTGISALLYAIICYGEDD